jgi:hypothetical protein
MAIKKSTTRKPRDPETVPKPAIRTNTLKDIAPPEHGKAIKGGYTCGCTRSR